MGSVSKKSMSLYGTLLRAYPASFQRRYAVTMEQTFDDMLDSEKSRFGRVKIWTRTFVDLPFSAGKEHVTNGKETYMTRNFKLLLAGAVAAILIVGAGSFWFGILHARGAIGVEHVTTAQLADAMQQDGFYSDYGNAAVIFSAKVAGVTERDNTALVTFVTGRPYSVTCQFPRALSVKAGQSLNVVAPGGSADRQPHGVLLHDCVES